MTFKSCSNGRPASLLGPGAQKPTNPGWFRKGQSGNLRGRPRRSSRGPETSAFEILLDKTLTVTKGDKTREISIEEALQQRTFQDALAGKRMAVREVLKWISMREAWFAKQVPPLRRDLAFKTSPDPDNVDAALVLLGIAASNPDRADLNLERAQLLLEPWAVQLALRRGPSLTDRDRGEVRRSMRDADILHRPGSRGQ
jgi:Family of unknown function (DUF5681)